VAPQRQRAAPVHILGSREFWEAISISIEEVFVNTEDRNVAREIITVIAQLAETSREAVTSCGSISTLPGWDSLKHIILFATIERTLQIKVPMDEFLAADRLVDILDLAKEPQL
jgi:acyl carrier protein